MARILNITNGDSAVHLMREASIPGEYLPWRDVLHEGPVQADLSLQQLSNRRARFIAERGWMDLVSLEQDFAERDQTLIHCADYDQVVLWFEHDLYDQLQIVQILDWFADNPPPPGTLSMICTEQYLGMCSPRQIADLRAQAAPVSDAQLLLAKHAWRAFRSADPLAWQALLQVDTTALPFLSGAVLRQLQEYPDCTTGLSLTAQRALQILSEGDQPPGKLFGLYMQQEERRFMGDASFWVILQELLGSDPPLLQLPAGIELTLPGDPEQLLKLTPAGTEVLRGERNWLDLTELDRWIGGVHLTPGHRWCWNPEKQRLIRQA